MRWFFDKSGKKRYWVNSLPEGAKFVLPGCEWLGIFVVIRNFNLGSSYVDRLVEVSLLEDVEKYNVRDRAIELGVQSGALFDAEIFNIPPRSSVYLVR